MKLIADAGSTKIAWAVVEDNGSVSMFESSGVNALALNDSELHSALEEALVSVDLNGLDAVYYYGAGCATPAVCSRVAAALPRARREKEVGSDMLGAARALLGNRPGLASILGTGSNSALYDGTRLTANMAPLGYVLGDEGSGASLGRRLLRRVYRSEEDREWFLRASGLDYGQVLQNVYSKPGANRFLASLVPLIVSERERLEKTVIAPEFAALFEALGAFYEERRISFVGGVAATLEPELRRAAARAGFTVDKILKNPISGLVEYHNYG